MDLLLRAADSYEQLSRLKELVPRRSPRCLRRYFSESAIDICIQHARAGVWMVRTGEHAAAMVMLRPVLESGAVAYWAAYAATEDQLRRIHAADDERAHRKEDVPELKCLIDQLVERKPDLPGIQQLQVLVGSKSPEGRWINKYLHTGIGMIRRHLPGAVGFDESDIGLALTRFEVFSLVAANLGVALLPRGDEAEELQRFVDSRFRALSEFEGGWLGGVPARADSPLDDIAL